MRFQVLDAEDADDLTAWTLLWDAWPHREVMAHPEYVRLFARPCDRAFGIVGETDGGTVLLPLVVRPLSAEPWVRPEDRRWDATSPYGYGGAFAVRGEPDGAAFWRAYREWARDAQIVTTFLRMSLFRERILPPPDGLEVCSSNVVVSLDGGLDAVWLRYVPNVRRWIRSTERTGLTVERDATGARLDAFVRLYESTMRRREATPFYFFPRTFYERLLERLAGHYVFHHALLRGEVVGSDLTLASADHAYHFLVGTAETALRLGTNYLLKHSAAGWAIEAGKRDYVLGGSHTPGDGLYRHKLGFAPRGAVPFRVARLVHDERAYRELCDERAAAAGPEHAVPRPSQGYFPEYRA
ncbi:GNAT family N-acetyltransferase [Anaeromyxobacter oryzae]|uniref:GNAT family N-acetyltransferase n=1 Tax=Anaeromyxobacter oryzae TaxID=2918170 RepID=UPI0020BF43B7|nr:GNAT family N-acetyltransferase [Anaeromyxobacter oryzae]